MDALYSLLHMVGQVLFGGYFVLMGMNHFLRQKELTGYAESKHVSNAELAVLVSGVIVFLGGLAVLFGVYVRAGLLLILLFLIPVTFTMHRFWEEHNAHARALDMTQFLKNIALIGATLLLM